MGIIAIGSDHGGLEMKQAIIEHLKNKGETVLDFGAKNHESYDYPNASKEVATCILEKKAEKGILICGTGIGISIAANKFNGIRAAVCTDEFMTKYTVLHNDANILCLGARVIGIGKALDMVDIYLETKFEGGRHQTRLDMIKDIENKV